MEPRTLLDLRTATRVQLNDRGTARPRWADDVIDRGLNEAQVQAALRARLLRDETGSITTLPVLANQATYLLDRSIFEVESVWRIATGEPLTQAYEDQLYRESARWRTRTAGQACEFVVQELPNERLRLLLVPIPTEDDALQLRVFRLPRTVLEDDGDEPEIAPRHHDGLVAWACYRCLMVRDVDGYDPVKAAEHKAEFEREFGPLPDAEQRRRQRQRRSHTTVPRSF